jgi:hypothetical protein
MFLAQVAIYCVGNYLNGTKREERNSFNFLLSACNYGVYIVRLNMG